MTGLILTISSFAFLSIITRSKTKSATPAKRKTRKKAGDWKLTKNGSSVKLSRAVQYRDDRGRYTSKLNPNRVWA